MTPPSPYDGATSPASLGRKAASSLLVQCIGVLRIDHLFGNVEGEAGAGHRGEVAQALVLPVLFQAERSETPPTRQGDGRLPFALRRVGVELFVERRHRAIERVAVNAGMPELLACQPARGATPMQ